MLYQTTISTIKPNRMQPLKSLATERLRSNGPIRRSTKLRDDPCVQSLPYRRWTMFHQSLAVLLSPLHPHQCCTWATRVRWIFLEFVEHWNLGYGKLLAEGSYRSYQCSQNTNSQSLYALSKKKQPWKWPYCSVCLCLDHKCWLLTLHILEYLGIHMCNC